MTNSVVALPVPVYLTIENPAVVLTDTVDAIVPSLFAEPAPPAFQHHVT